MFWVLEPEKQVDTILVKEVILSYHNTNESMKTRKMTVLFILVYCNEKPTLRCTMWVDKKV